MSEMAKKARAALKAKAQRMGSAGEPGKTDASSWTPPAALNTEAKTGLRPVSRQHLKTGGKVHGETKHHAGRKPRKSGGNVADEIVNRNVKDANAEFGKPHDGGYKKGGRSCKESGGALGQTGVPVNRMKFSQNTVTPGQKNGGRIARKSGGRAKGKTNINIIIGGGHGQPAAPPPMPPHPPMMPPPMPPQAMAPPPPPPGPPPGAGGPSGMAPPPMMRKDGGRVARTGNKGYFQMEGGGLSGLGRLNKAKRQAGRD